MMIDSSAILAIALQEPEAEDIPRTISRAAVRRMSAVNWLESLIVTEGRHGEESADDTLLILEQLGIEAVPFDREQMFEARSAWRRFGKGRHPAAPNLGDCCAYAAAIIWSEPLLFKGTDFSKTDVPPVEW